MGRVTFPTIVDNPTKDLIFDWFQYREVCDNEKFNTFFNRTLSKCWRKYQQLLRIQPGEEVEFDDGVVRRVTYDWMVQEYRELMHETKDESENTESITSENGVTRNSSDEGVKTTTMVGDDTTARSGMTSVVTAGTSDTASSNVTDLDTRDEMNGTSSTTNADGTVTDVDHDGSNGSTDKTLGKAAPQSISYGSGGMPSTLDWQYPSSQQENKHEGTDGYNDTTNSSHSSVGSTTVGDVTTHTGDTTNSGTTATEHQQTSDGTSEEGVQFDTERATAENDSRTGVQTESGSSASAKIGSGTHDQTHKEMMQGRSIDIATLLENAKNFILGSTAWDFLYGEIDKCFISIYND